MSTSDKAEWILYDTDLTTKLAILPVMSSHLYLEHNEPGSGEVKIPLSSNAAAVIENGMFIECLYRGQGRGSFFVDNIAKTYANADENAGKVLSVSGRGGMALLEDAIIYDGNTGETSREFTAVTKASIFVTLVTEAQARGALASLTLDFDAVNDSASVAWTDSETYKLNVGTSLLDVLRQFAKTGIDFEMNYSAGGFILSAYKNGTGTDKSETIYFRTGANCEEVASDERGDEIKNVLYTKYKDGFISVSDSTSISARRRREKLLSLELAQTAASATTYASAELSTNKDPKKSIAVRIYDGVNPRLFVDYSMGDYITLDIAGTEYRYRVLGIQADFSGDQYSNVVVELNSLLYANNLRMDQDLEWLKNQWNTARDSKLMAVSYWAAIGDPSITYDASNFVIIGDTLYMINSLSLYSYGLTSGVWTALEYGTLAFPKCLAAVGTDLYIGASLVVYKYDTLTATLTNVALTNPGDPLARAVYAMAVNGTTLYASGTFTTINGVAAVNIAKLNTLTNTWSAMADQASFLATNPLILKMLFSNGLLYSSAGTQVQAWNGTTWSNVGSAFSTAIVCYAEYGTSLLIGNGDAGGIWEWDGATWAVFGGGVNNAVRAIAVYLTDVYVGGDFTDVGNYVARYSGGTWWQLETGTNASVEHLILNGQDLYVAGNFTTVGTDNKEAQGIAAYFNNFTSLAEYLENSSSFNMGAAIHAAAASAITDTDEVPFWEATVNALRKITWANILTTIRTWLLSATATTQVLYNDTGVIDSEANFIYDKTYSAIQIGGTNWYSALLYGGLHVTKENGGNFVPMMTGHSYGDGTGNFTNVPTMGGDRAGGTKATPTAVLSDMGLARFTGGGYDGTALSGTRAQMLLKAAGDWSATSHPTAIEFWTTPSGSITRELKFVIGPGGVASNITAGKILTLTATDNFTLTVPATGQALVATVGATVANRIPYYSTTTGSVTSSANLTFGANLTLLNGAAFVSSYSTNALFDAFTLTNSNTGAGAGVRAGVVSDKGTLYFEAFSAAYSVGNWQGKSGLLANPTLNGILIASPATIQLDSSNTAVSGFIFNPTDGSFVGNEAGNAAGDFRYESDTEANFIFLDANGNTDGTLYLGGSTNGIQILKGGEMSFIGTATVWDDLRVSPDVKGTGAKDPSWVAWLGSVNLYDFDNATAGSEKELWFNVQMPHGWKEGSSVYPHVHWTNKTAGTAGHVVRWGLEYTVSKIGGTFPATATVYGTTIVGGGDITVANEHMITSFDAITMTGNTISTILSCRLFRNSSNAADTYTGTAGLLSIDWHFEVDKVGSKTEFA